MAANGTFCAAGVMASVPPMSAFDPKQTLRDWPYATNMVRTFGLATFLLTLAACTSHNQGLPNLTVMGADEVFIPVSGRSLESLVKGRALAANRGDGIVVGGRPRFEDRVWRFETDGRTFDASGIAGTYKVLNSTICVRVAPSVSAYCFGIGKRSDGSLYRLYSDGRAPEPIRIF